MRWPFSKKKPEAPPPTKQLLAAERIVATKQLLAAERIVAEEFPGPEPAYISVFGLIADRVIVTRDGVILVEVVLSESGSLFRLRAELIEEAKDEGRIMSNVMTPEVRNEAAELSLWMALNGVWADPKKLAGLRVQHVDAPETVGTIVVDATMRRGWGVVWDCLGGAPALRAFVTPSDPAVLLPDLNEDATRGRILGWLTAHPDVEDWELQPAGNWGDKPGHWMVKVLNKEGTRGYEALDDPPSLVLSYALRMVSVEKTDPRRAQLADLEYRIQMTQMAGEGSAHVLAELAELADDLRRDIYRGTPEGKDEG